MKVVIVGGVAGGATAAARIRRLDEKAEIIIFEQSGYISYANCGLPYFIGGEITEATALTLQTPQQFFNRYRIQARVHHKVTAVNTKQKTVTVVNLRTNETFEESYDKLLLSPGSKPIVPPLPGKDNPRIFTLRNVEDTFAIDEFIKENRPKRAVVIGGGFIGLETAENLKRRGLSVTLIELLPQVFVPFDYDMASFVHDTLKRNGINLILGAGVSGFAEVADGSTEVQISGKEPLYADLVILAVGVAPDNALAESAGLKTGVKGAIQVNEKMETSVPDIYAVGDAAEIRNLITGDPALVPLAGPANKQGRIAADNICGGNSAFKGAQGSSVLKLFEMTFAATGLNEAAARKAGIEFDKTVTFSPSHATYYPGAGNMTVKVLFSPNASGRFKKGQILGAQIAGTAGVDKRIDVLAAAVRCGATAGDLTDWEFAYAPPYSSAKDPVNIAGYVMTNVLDGAVRQFHWYDVARLKKESDSFFIDVRTPAEYASGHIEGSLNIPVDSLRERLDEIPKGKDLCLICQSALRSYIACRILSSLGWNCSHLSGGYRFYKSATEGNAEHAARLCGECGAPL